MNRKEMFKNVNNNNTVTLYIKVLFVNYIT